MDQGREVFAVPGSPLDPRSQGTNALIKDGATLIESARDVAEILEPMLRTPLQEGREREFHDAIPQAEDGFSLDQARKRVRELLTSAPVGVDELIRQCQLSPPVVTTVLLELELAGRIGRHPGNKVALRLEPESVEHGDASERTP